MLVKHWKSVHISTGYNQNSSFFLATLYNSILSRVMYWDDGKKIVALTRRAEVHHTEEWQEYGIVNRMILTSVSGKFVPTDVDVALRISAAISWSRYD